ncbi:MAG: homoserine kinase [Verrucomicrobiota bacterium]|nr:homoserine kinase [Verrucomicrobiota bacterium]
MNSDSLRPIMVKRSILVRVPATTANLGPGFDTLGVALQLYNDFELTLLDAKEIEIVAELDDIQLEGAKSLIKKTAEAFYAQAGIGFRGFRVEITNDVPLARGLGSSSTVIVGIVAGLNRLLGKPLKKKDLVNLVASIEGHPDNVVPALVGGFVASSFNDGRVVYLRKELPYKLKFIVFIPDVEIETSKAREILPAHYSRQDVVRNINQACLLTAAIISGEYKLIGQFLDDRIHQPYRAELLPELYNVISCGQKAGALGGWLSGSGSTICCVTLEKAALVAQSMKKAYNKKKNGGVTRILAVDNQGVTFQ